MLVGPIVFCTVVTGVARMRDLGKVGRVGLKAIVYFEVLTTIALVIGLVVGKTLQPGAGLNVDPAKLDTKAIAGYVATSKGVGVTQFLLDVIPSTFADAFAKGELLPILLVSVLFGAAAARMGSRAQAVVELVDQTGHVFFGIVGFVMRLAPVGAFGAMAFSVGESGLG